jgi:type I restriction-modification system DNA methylase subunit
MTAPKEIVKLVERFDHNREQYTSGNYNEAQLRQEFINPFFSALGWDVENRQGYAEPYKEVIHEDAIKIGTATKAPDYAFRIGGTRKFFVEAKNPSINLKEDLTPSYQLRRYAWSAKLPLSVLTDFEEFAIYDCHTRPFKTDKASTSRMRYLSYKEYIMEWESIASVFSKEAVLKGSFDKYAESTKGKKGTAEVDDAFLREIESWRDSLAKNIAIRNPKLSQRELNFAVQRTIDRIIFLRICEDRGIEQYGRLLALVNGERVYRRLYEQFARADEKYNSGLFHFEPEKGRPEQPDEISPNLHIDDKPLKEIIGNLYYPDCPYEFSVLPADILGQVYEQFLGKVIRLTAGHQAKVEEKPEVKKAGGVYYTPTYIVDYIVKNTVGKLLGPEPSPHPKKADVILNEAKRSEGSAPKPSKPLTPKEASKLRILDPACGSGSFLIGAYQYLLDWHRDWYEKDGAEKHATGKTAALFRGPGGEWRLTTTERKRILLNNIYGVDIDSQAVEVTKLSLLLKVLEGENEQTISQQLKMFHERALPDLGSNIKCGNSLIGPDFYDGKQLSLLDDEEKNRINVFDWKTGFKEIMDAGGFDAVIGNPPYVRIQGFPSEQIEYFTEHYKSATGNYDLYISFVEKGYSILSKNGRFGMILPNKFFKTDYGQGLRRMISGEKCVRRIVDFGANQVFDATTYTSLLFLLKAVRTSFEYASSAANALILQGLQFETIAAENLAGDTWLFMNTETNPIQKKLSKRSVRLLDLPAEMSRGSSSGDDSVFMLPRNSGKVEKAVLRLPVFATDFNRYFFTLSKEWEIIFPYKHEEGAYSLLEEDELRVKFPRCYKYLLSHQSELKRRKQFRTWFSYSAARNLELHEKAHIMVPLLAERGSFALVPREVRGRLCPMASGGFSITVSPNCELKPEYVLGLLNSTLLFWKLRNESNVFRGGWITCTKQYFGELPIRSIDFSNPIDKSRHDKMVQFVEQMLSLHKQLPVAKTEQEKTVIQRQIEATDKQIDELVYELYGLTEEEIRIVEGKV